MEQDKISGGKNQKLLRSKKKLGWTGSKEIEEICAMLITTLTTPPPVDEEGGPEISVDNMDKT